MNNMSPQEAIRVLEEIKEEYNQKIEKIYNSYCIYPNPDDQRDYDECGYRIDAIKIGIMGIEAFMKQQKQ